MTDSGKYFEDLAVGQEWLSLGRTVLESDIGNFACLTGDFNPLHVDHEFAANSLYRKPLAHGLLGISWAAGLGSHFPRVNTLAFSAVRDWEFLKPVYAGDTLHLVTTVLDKIENGRRSGKVAWLLKLMNQRAECVQQGVFETIVSTRISDRLRTESNVSTNGELHTPASSKLN